MDRLLTASGRLPVASWREAVAAGRASHRVGERLVQGGLLTPVELEATVLSALHGAALFLLCLDSAIRLDMGETPAIGPVVRVDLRDACAEVDRRRRALDDAWPDSRMDTHAVVPVRSLSGHHVGLNALQWEIVAHADRRRTPIDLARSLGRDTFATLLEVRRMARAGLVGPGRPGGRGAAGRWIGAGDHSSADATAPDDGIGTGEDADEQALEPPAHPAPAGAEPAPLAVVAGVDAGPVPLSADDRPLARRTASPVRWSDGAGPSPDVCPVSVLLRIRDGLAAL
ncbi:hypothetical protein [Micromonospora thermarum]|uniref:Uncharacterized protein n=1 Tax=Micromonospora thermarum TaxID=2720024 RepID=A0ABX0ZAK5_9ACTN|nr:hypothetical protein [Micromonospora thermarum]NJP34947.1 hypothetical protein [Micromonospora thermarum]